MNKAEKITALISFIKESNIYLMDSKISNEFLEFLELRKEAYELLLQKLEKGEI
jgi:hypothetical protein